MLAPIATLAFLAALWLAARVIAELLVRRGSRVLAALRGVPWPAAMKAGCRPRSVASRRHPALHGRPKLRAAA